MRETLMRVGSGVTGLLVGAAIVTMSLVACASTSGTSAGGTCCQFTGPVAHDCAAIENLGPGADLDGRCNQVNQGQSCSWFYNNDACCEVAVNDGFPGSVQCN